ncbi:MAG: hypothetical protein K2G13_08495 [Muribaculaceae bacterium]|nr:hypothetical protein [Muribaculaceae bacterium]
MEKSVRMNLLVENPQEKPRACQMSLEFYQNARMTMGELRDMVRAGIFSWDFLEHHIREAQRPKGVVENSLQKFDDYSIGLGKTLHDKPINVW